jgi:hypothetical protein
VAAETTLRAGAAALAGDAAAVALYEEASTAWRALGLPLHLALCLIERDRCLTGAASVGEGSAEAEGILEGLGAAGMLRAIRPLAPQRGAARSS